ncbi:lysophospholipase [Fomes fomentarius]|nr:lysophospholipase [Fomes fomentarius]
MRPGTSKTYAEAWLPGWDGLNFYTRTYTASSPRAVAVFVHGFAEYVGRYEWAHGVYASKGITVFAFDQRGFGLTALDLEHKSKESKYGKTSWADQFADLEWWLKYVKDKFPTLPIFLAGHSMGGALCIGFVTRKSPPPAGNSASLVTGVVSGSPLLLLTNPPSPIVLYLGALVSKVYPSFVIPAPVDPNALSHDPVANAANAKDALCPQKGSLKGVYDMITGGQQLVRHDYENWPSELPLLLVHGTEDKVTSFTASQEFYEKVQAQDKEFIAVEHGYHELVHEPDGVKEKFVNDCIEWILKHVSGPQGH